MENEENRRETFRLKWKKEYNVDPEILIKNHFWYTGFNDLVECSFCYGRLSHWKQGDDVVQKHDENFPECKKTYNKIRWEKPRYEIKHPNYASLSSRMESYAECDFSTPQFPEAGLFYTGSGDSVTCFSCGGTLSDWQIDDEPMEEHIFWFGDECKFLLERYDKKHTEMMICARKMRYATLWDDQKPKISKLFRIALNQHSRSRIYEEMELTLNRLIYNHKPPTHDVEELREKVEALKEDKCCKICLTGERNTLFLPCVHFVSCNRCGTLLKDCPLCKKHIVSTLKIYPA